MIKTALRFMVTAGALCVLLPLSPASAQVYKWTDDKGEVHYGDNPYALKDAQGEASVVIPPKKKTVEPETATAEQVAEPSTAPSQDKPAVENPKPSKVENDKTAAPPAAKKEEAAKAPPTAEEPVKKVRISKRLLRAKKLEKEKSASSDQSSTSTAP